MIWGSFTSLLLAEASRGRYVNSTGVLFCHTAPAGCHGLTSSAAPPDRLTPAALLTTYRSGNGWLLDDGTAVTDQSGLVVFGNVAFSNSGLQTVVVTRAATATRPAEAGGEFAVKVAPGVATLAAVNVQL